jgi:hypothetical protein
MEAINNAIKLNIQNHFERWCRECDAGCSNCPFNEECGSLTDQKCRCLCEIITGKRMNEMTHTINAE